MKSYKYYFSIVFVFSYFGAFSQTITNVQAKQYGDQVIITYDLSEDADKIILEMDDGRGVFRTLKEATGDLGKNVRQGNKKTIIWEPANAVFYSNCIFRVIIQDSRFVDKRDGKKYEMVKIGSQTWMAENLNYNTRSGSWCYDNNSGNCAKYGRLYDWETAKKVCPSGWHLPTDAEWTRLTDNLGGEGEAGKKIKTISGWDSNGNGTNSSGFAGLPGGSRGINGPFDSIGSDGYWWSSSQARSSLAWYRAMSYSDGEVGRGSGANEQSGFSVRCLRDF